MYWPVVPLQFNYPHRMGDDRNVPTIEQCKKHAAEYKTLGKDPKISARRSAVPLSISRSWTALANQLEALTVIIKDEGK